MQATELPTVWQGKAAGWRTVATMLAAAAAMCLLAVILYEVIERTPIWLRALTITAIVFLIFGAMRCVAEALAATRIVVRVAGLEVRVRSRLFPWAGMHIPVRELRSAGVVDADARPWRSFGWWSSGPGPTALVRSGRALSLELASGQHVLVSVDEPEEAVQLVQRMMGTT